MKTYKLPGADPIFEHTIPRSLMGRDLIHFAHVYPNEQTALCGQQLGNSYGRAPQTDFSYKVCRRCYVEARLAFLRPATEEQPTAAAMVIRYGINRRDPENPHQFLHRNHRATVPAFAWEDRKAHARLCNTLIAKHPGWGLTGYIVEKG